MPVTIVLKGIPDAVYERLKDAASANHRSLNSEIIARLEAQLLPQRTSAMEHLTAIRAIRARLKKASFSHADIDRIKRQGRS